jgi:phage baseplate assembly protein gpV
MNDGELYKRVMQKTGEGLRVAMPARVESYDATRSIADVFIFIPQRRGDGSSVTTPVIAEVPVLWNRAGQASITFPLTRGDQGLVIFCDYDIGAWAVELDENTPQSLRRHNLTDAVFLPQTHGLKESSALGLSLQYGANQVLIANDFVTITQGSNTLVMNASGVTLTAGNITLAGNVAVSGTLSVGGKDFDTHTHSGVQTGAGNTGAPN